MGAYQSSIHQPAEDRGDDAQYTKSPTSASKLTKSSNDQRVHLLRQHCQIWWRSGQRHRLSKATNAFWILNSVWKFQQYWTRTKLKLYQSCVISIMLYGSECWRMTDADVNKLSIFHTKNIRKIMRIFWPNTISKEQLLTCCKQDSIGSIIMRWWRWIGHLLRREPKNITHIALYWTPEGKRKRQTKEHLASDCWTLTREPEPHLVTIQRLAQNRQKWRAFVAALHAKGIMGSKYVTFKNIKICLKIQIHKKLSQKLF